MSELTPAERRIRRRLRDDFEHYAARCLRIRTKSGAIAPLVLNDAQRYIVAKLEEQAAKTGRVRALILKGRQQGCSTVVEARFFHKVTHRPGVRAFILTHEDEASKNIFELAERYYEHCPALVRPSCSASNARELLFDKLDSGYRVATAGTKNTGRSATIQLFHGSESAFWPNAEDHAAGALQAVPGEAGTEVILESTSNGPRGLFYDMWQAATRGEGDYIAIFVPWFWQSEYRRPCEPGFEKTSEERQYATEHGVDDEQINWRRHKVVELGGLWTFRREYPATPDEAFMAETPGALWTRALIEENRVHALPPLRRIAIAVDPATTSRKSSDETGIVAGGVGIDGHAYVFLDESQRSKPGVWAAAVVDSYKKHVMNIVVAEVNQGGEMVEHTIHTVDATVPVHMVSASKSKRARAEPIAALDSQHKIHHVGYLPGLEDQMCTWNAAGGEDSPDRIDARTWLLTELMLGGGLTGPLAIDPEAGRAAGKWDEGRAEAGRGE